MAMGDPIDWMTNRGGDMRRFQHPLDPIAIG